MSGIYSKDFSIVICGEAGQGIQTVESILIQAIKMGGYHVFSSKEYMSRVRGGENSTEIRISSKRITAYVDRIDLLLALSEGAVDHLKQRISSETLILGDNQHLNSVLEGYNTLKIPLLARAQQLGGPIFSNVIAAGVISKILNIPLGVFEDIIRGMFLRKGENIVKKDIEAGKKGYEIGEELIQSGRIKVQLERDPKITDELLLNGTEAVGMGCLAGNCKFMSSYPMTPSTPLQMFMAGKGEDFNLIFEQAEDEIAAINMSIGAFYAGARSMVATSGSGFALMGEAVGLSGITETPVVVYVGQRPGPAVGLPTRTSQEDLNLTLYSGPGEFARIIFAPGKLEDAFKLAHAAFNLADKYQIPVFILSDQYFAECYYNLPSLDLDGVKNEDYIIKTSKDYKRYQFTEGGVSPRGIPGFGEGLVVADADEHDEEGHITENLQIRAKMVDKRIRRKMETIRREAISPELIGSDDYDVLVIGWGSTYGTLKEALNNLDDNRISFLHFKQLYPLDPDTQSILKKAFKTIIFENNATAQFANLIKLETGFEIDKKVLKYDGMPFSVEEVTKTLEKFMGEL
ncbi:MAG: 2-oxoglutarate synthase subunit KorA [Methanobacterium sp. PtaU1.Bin242]|nr:MAG: 2-oxoglutarate synthase subunit KorA [Methanobacterium sp. PtaU1.Bin242]